MKTLALHFIQTTCIVEQIPLLKYLHSCVIETEIGLMAAWFQQNLSGCGAFVWLNYSAHPKIPFSSKYL